MLGERLFELRKNKNLSQEDVAEKLNVTRQTISKWETGQSMPDFDKIVPLCELYEITTDELLTGKKSIKEKEGSRDLQDKIILQKRRKAKAVSISVFLYFLSVIWLIVMESLHVLNDNMLAAGFMFICALATVNLIYQFMSAPRLDRIEKVKEQKKYKLIDHIIAMIFFCIYMLVSFFTAAWGITWLLWVVYAIAIEITHLIFELREEKNEKK